MKHKFIDILIIVLLFSTFKANAQSSCLFKLGNDDTYSIRGVGCDNWVNYAPYPNMNSVPIKYIRIDIHVIQDIDGNNNFLNIPSNTDFLSDIIERVNSKLTNLQELNLNVTSPHINDSRIRLSLDSIYFHQDSILWDFSGSGNYTTANLVYNKYIVNNTELSQEEKFQTLHIFVGDNINSGSAGGWASGIGSKKYIATRGYYDNYSENSYEMALYSCAKNITHEIGHSFGLYHNFHGGSAGSQCDDCSDNDPRPAKFV